MTYLIRECVEKEMWWFGYENFVNLFVQWKGRLQLHLGGWLKSPTRSSLWGTLFVGLGIIIPMFYILLCGLFVWARVSLHPPMHHERGWMISSQETILCSVSVS
jgi:hypothetical protein